MPSERTPVSDGSDEVDHLILSAACSFDSPPPEEVSRGLLAGGLTARKNRFLATAHTIDTNDYELRNRLLESTGTTLLESLVRAGVSSRLVDKYGARVQLHISLSSSSGRAGIHVPFALWEPWADLKATLRVDVI